jgi:hypothetical protein
MFSRKQQNFIHYFSTLRIAAANSIHITYMLYNGLYHAIHYKKTMTIFTRKNDNVQQFTLS